jgi:hypothetical protein
VTPVLLVSGPRDGVSPGEVWAALAPRFSPAVLLVAGGARGVDTISVQLWRSWGGWAEEHPVSPAEWQRDPDGAGHARNARMVARVKAAGGSALVFDLPCRKPSCRRRQPHNTHGTSNCVQEAEQAGLPVDHWKVTGAR